AQRRQREEVRTYSPATATEHRPCATTDTHSTSTATARDTANYDVLRGICQIVHREVRHWQTRYVLVRVAGKAHKRVGCPSGSPAQPGESGTLLRHVLDDGPQVHHRSDRGPDAA